MRVRQVAALFAMYFLFAVPPLPPQLCFAHLESPRLQSAVQREHQGALLALGGAANWGGMGEGSLWRGYESSRWSQPGSLQH